MRTRIVKGIVLFLVGAIFLSSHSAQARRVRDGGQDLKAVLLSGNIEGIVSGKIKLPAELEALRGVRQEQSTHQGIDVFDHTMNVLRAVSAYHGLNQDKALLLYTAALFHDLGKIICDGANFLPAKDIEAKLDSLGYSGLIRDCILSLIKTSHPYKHATWSEILAEPILVRLGYSRYEIRAICFLIKNHGTMGNMAQGDTETTLEPFMGLNPSFADQFILEDSLSEFVESSFLLTYADISSIPGLKKYSSSITVVYEKLNKQLEELSQYRDMISSSLIASVRQYGILPGEKLAGLGINFFPSLDLENNNSVCGIVINPGEFLYFRQHSSLDNYMIHVGYLIPGWPGSGITIPGEKRINLPTTRTFRDFYDSLGSEYIAEHLAQNSSPEGPPDYTSLIRAYFGSTNLVAHDNEALTSFLKSLYLEAILQGDAWSFLDVVQERKSSPALGIKDPAVILSSILFLVPIEGLEYYYPKNGELGVSKVDVQNIAYILAPKGSIYECAKRLFADIPGIQVVEVDADAGSTPYLSELKTIVSNTDVIYWGHIMRLPTLRDTFQIMEDETEQ